MKIKLKDISIKNFRGIKSLDLNLEGKNVTVYGQNGTGKTTIAEAIHYLLFNQGLTEKTINIVPKDSNNIEQKELTPTVKATFEIDGNDTTFERRSVYNKSTNGRSNKQFINEVDKSVTDYNAYINEVIDVEQFKLLTNPNTFFQLHWKERRNTLTDLIDDITDEDIINENKALTNVPKILGNVSVDDKKTILNRSIKQVKEEIKNIPVRIEENLQNVTKEEATTEELEQAIKSKDDYINILKDKIIQLKNSNGASLFKNEIASKEIELNILMNKLQNEKDSKTRGKSDEINMLRGDVKTLTREINIDVSSIERMEVERKNLLDEYHETNAKAKQIEHMEFEYISKTVCNCCTQHIPKELQEVVKEKELEKFNIEKSNEKERLNNKKTELIKVGKQTKQDIERTEKTAKEKQEKLANLKSEINSKESELERFNSKKLVETDDIISLKKEITQLKKQLNHTDDNSEVIKALNSDVHDLTREKSELEQIMARLKRNKELDKRIETLKDEERLLQAKLDDLEEQLDLLDQLTKTKMRTLTDAINNQFNLIQVKLFHEKNNGDLDEVCEIMVNGVEYNDGLNNAARINAGLDIINTLSKSYDTYAPIFVDNAESVNEVLETESQQILLNVSKLKKHEKLEMIIEGDK